MSRHGVLALLLLVAAPAWAGTAYQCTSANGKVSYQDKPCAPGQRQQALQLDDAEPPTPAAVAAPPPAEAPPRPAPSPPPEPVAPLPVMYACMRATDGKTYFSENGNPPPYQAPYGILGASQLPLSQVYGPGGGGGASAPELNRGKITPGLVARHYVWVQDSCRPLTSGETCRALRDAYDEVEMKLQRAFKSDRPPLEQREATLLSQLRGC